MPAGTLRENCSRPEGPQEAHRRPAETLKACRGLQVAMSWPQKQTNKQKQSNLHSEVRLLTYTFKSLNVGSRLLRKLGITLLLPQHKTVDLLSNARDRIRP